MEDELRKCVKDALEMLYQRDKRLILNDYATRNYNHNSERGIVCHFSSYLANIIEKNDMFAKYNIDCEYNRNKGDKKCLPSFKNGVFPDLIIHKRGFNDDNLLVAEFKGWWNSSDNELGKDRLKIAQFMDKAGEYEYQFGLLVVLGEEREKIKIEWSNQNSKETKLTWGQL